MHPNASHAPDSLRYGHPDWVRDLSRGAGITGWGLIVAVAAGFVAEVLPFRVVILPCRLAAAAGAAALFYGAWRLSSPDPNGSTPAADAAARWTLRLALAAGVGGALAGVVVHSGFPGPNLLDPLSVVMIVAGAIDLAGRLAFLLHLRRLASRLPDATLAKGIGSLLPAYGLALAALAATDALRALPMLDRLGAAAAVGVAVVTLVVLKHLRQLRRGLVIQTDYARGIWSRGPAARPGAFGLA